MKNKYKNKKILSLFLIIVVIATIVPLNGITTNAMPKQAKKIVLNYKSKSIFVGNTLKMKVKKITPSNFSKRVIWKTSNKKIATISNTGKIKAKKAGTAKITAILKKDSKIKATCKIKIYNKTKKIKLISKKKYNLNVGSSLKLKAKVTKPRKSAKPIKWESSNSKIAKITKNGLVKALSPGTAKMKASSGRKSVSVKISVNKNNIALYNITFDSRGGSFISPQTIERGKTITLPNNPTRNGFVFKGWYSDKELSSIYDINNIINSDITLYAKWEAVNTYQDNDDDNVKDIIEDFFDADTTKNDTDGDGLTDYQEIYMTGTEPAIIDTDMDGILDGEEDFDKDGLNNLEEISLGTNPSITDSDSDNLSDYDEVKIYNTNPLIADTDYDGASDGWEVENKFNPLVFDNNFNIVENVSGENINVSVEMDVNGENTEDLSITENSNDTLINETMPGYVDSAYDFEFEQNNFNSATIKFEFDRKLLNNDNFDPAIYYFDEKNQLLQEVRTTIKDNIAYAKVTHFSTYILLNKADVDDFWENRIKAPSENNMTKGLSISFVIDRSNSMTWNDTKNLRNSLTNSFIDKLSENKDKGSAISFIAEAEVLTELTNNTKQLKDAINSIVDDNGHNSNSGTNGSAGIYEALNQLKIDNSGNERNIIFITDGEDTNTTYSYDDLIIEAKENNISIYSIGLGDANDRILKKIASETGGEYYYATTSDMLYDIYENIQGETIDFITDSNNDGISDYYTKLLCEGTLRLGTGVKVFEGIPYEEVQKSNDYDNDGIKNGEEIIVTLIDNKTLVKINSSPILEDTDYDGINDNIDLYPINNTFNGRMKGYTDINDANYTMDFRQFFGNSHLYNTNICSASLVFANAIYKEGGFEYSLGIHKNITDITELMKYHGFNHVEDYKLKDRYSDDDISEVAIGYRNMTYDKKKITVLGIIIRGTDGSIEEWSSNFDMGNPVDWHYENHKGFQRTEERIREYINSYISIHQNQMTSETVYWITGHSRGAALANLLAAHYIDNSKKVFAYTFATPSTTISQSKNNILYNSIINFANASDVVPYVPLSQWKFGRFGNTIEFSLEDLNLEKDWCNKTGKKEYNALNRSIINLLLNRIAKSCASSWEEVFDRAGSQDITDEQYTYISDRAKRYCDIIERTGLFTKEHKGYKLYPSTAFLFQLAAEMLTGSNDHVMDLIKELWNSRYTAVLLLMINDLWDDRQVVIINRPNKLDESLMGDGHAPATYYVYTNYLARYNTK